MPKQSIIDKRMLNVMKYAVESGIVASELDFMEAVGNYRTNLYKIKNGAQNFTKEQMLKACELTNTSADYLFGFTDIMQRKESKADPIDMIERALIHLKNSSHSH